MFEHDVDPIGLTALDERRWSHQVSVRETHGGAPRGVMHPQLHRAARCQLRPPPGSGVSKGSLTFNMDFKRVLNIQQDFKRVLKNSTGISRSLKFNRDFNTVLNIQQGFQKGPFEFNRRGFTRRTSRSPTFDYRSAARPARSVRRPRLHPTQHQGKSWVIKWIGK
jgi:hypothetical protein